MKEEEEEMQQNVSIYPTLHVIKMHALFSDKYLKKKY